jgi:hypothetical protein
MAMTISIISVQPEGYRWQVVEDGKVLRTGRAASRPEAFASGTKAIKDIEDERAFKVVKNRYK